MEEEEKLARFEQCVVPHLSAAYNLARWLARNEADAEDLVQDAYLRAFRFFDDFRGSDARRWLLTIVRNTCYTWLQRHRSEELLTPFAEEIHSPESETDPEALLLENAGREHLRQALEELPAEFREALILRELEGLSYKEIADVAGVPLGTVMSRLARARQGLQKRLAAPLRKEL